MVRFKVVKGSHLLLAAAILVLLAVVVFIVLQGGISFSGQSNSAAETAGAAAVQEAKALSAFASPAYSNAPLKIEIIADEPSDMPEDAPRILIYHTHTHEAYEQDQQNPYEAIETWRTMDEEHSVVRVGRALADALTDMGCSVVHDTTDHEQDSISDAYERSLETLEAYDEEFDLYIDLHRDAYVDGLEPCLQTDADSYAQLMLLVGRGDEYVGDEKPDYEGNLAFAQKLTGVMNAHTPGICRNVTVKKGRYNQHAGARCILVEVGHNKNTLQHALNSIPCLADSLCFTLNLFNN